MIMLSELLRFKVVADRGLNAGIADLGVRLLDSDYPPVSYLFYKTDKKVMRLPWEAVDLIETERRQIKVVNLSGAEEISLEASKDYVLLKTEILDALLLDLQNRRSIRANDLVLNQEDNQLVLKQADTSFNAIL